MRQATSREKCDGYSASRLTSKCDSGRSRAVLCTRDWRTWTYWSMMLGFITVNILSSRRRTPTGHGHDSLFCKANNVYLCVSMQIHFNLSRAAEHVATYFLMHFRHCNLNYLRSIARNCGRLRWSVQNIFGFTKMHLHYMLDFAVHISDSHWFVFTFRFNSKPSSGFSNTAPAVLNKADFATTPIRWGWLQSWKDSKLQWVSDQTCSMYILLE